MANQREGSNGFRLRIKWRRHLIGFLEDRGYIATIRCLIVRKRLGSASLLPAFEQNNVYCPLLDHVANPNEPSKHHQDALLTSKLISQPYPPSCVPFPTRKPLTIRMVQGWATRGMLTRAPVRPPRASHHVVIASPLPPVTAAPTNERPSICELVSSSTLSALTSTLQ